MTASTSTDVVPDPTASEVHPRLAQRALVPGSLNGLDQPGPPGADGLPGLPGAPGQGVPAGGTTGQVLAKESGGDYDTEWVDGATGTGTGMVAGPPISGATTVAPNTFYPINLAANLGNTPITLPTAPPQGTAVEFSRIDNNSFTSTPRITPGPGDAIIDQNPYPLVMRNSTLHLTYIGTSWYPSMSVVAANGMFGTTASSVFNPSIMARDNFGRAQIEDPVGAKDIVNLEYLQAHAGSGGGSDEVAIRPDDPTTPEPTAELWVDTDDMSAGVNTPTLVTDWNNAVPDGYYYALGSTPNAPTTSTYAGYTLSDKAGHYTQVIYRIVSSSTSIEQWQRQLVAPNWTPWKRIDLTPGNPDQIMATVAGTPSPYPFWQSGFAPVDNKFGNTNWTAPLSTDLITAAVYPVGASYMALSTTQGSTGGWPFAASAQIFTCKIMDPALDASTGWSRGFQVWVRNSNSSPSMYYRSGSAGGWSAWERLDNPTIWNTEVSIPINGVNVASKAITWPAGMFSAPPICSAMCDQSSTVAWNSNVSSITTSGGTVGTRSAAGINGGTTPMTVQIIAMDAL